MPGIEGKPLFGVGVHRLESVRAAYAIAIPARNEQDRIAACLDACAASMRASGVDGMILLLVNNSTDATARRAAAWARHTPIAIDIVALDLPQDEAHAGGARRRALQLARARIAATGALFTTDADSLPSRDWIGCSLAALAAGAAIVCGKVELDPAEFARLPAHVTAMGDIEDRYRRATQELNARLDPDPLNPWPHHAQMSGAAIALAAAAYDRIGGAPLIPVGEDRALVQLGLRHDLPVRFCEQARVLTSCRLDGRAKGGMADTILSRFEADDYLCDEALEPADRTLMRARLRADLRRLHQAGIAPPHLLRRAGLDETQQADALAQRSFGALWDRVERHSKLLQRTPFYWSELERELPRLLAMLACVQPRAVATPLLNLQAAAS